MANVKIEMNRGLGWEVRQEGDADVTADQVAGMLAAYAIQYPHRASIDGVLIAEVVKARANAKVVRHDRG